MAGVFPSETKIYIAPSGTAGSAAAVSGYLVSGEITNWSKTGGDQDVESIPVIGGYVTKENPRSEIELSFDVIVNNTAASTLDRYDILAMGAGQTSATEGDNKSIFIQSFNGTLYKTFGFNNCRCITWEPEMAADDMLKGSISFKLSPTTELGVANLKTSACAASTSFFSTWS